MANQKAWEERNKDKLREIYEGKKQVVITYSNELAYKNKLRVDKALKKAIYQLKNIQGRLKNSKLTRDELLIKVEKIIGKSYIRKSVNFSCLKAEKFTIYTG